MLRKKSLYFITECNQLLFNIMLTTLTSRYKEKKLQNNVINNYCIINKRIKCPKAKENRYILENQI